MLNSIENGQAIYNPMEGTLTSPDGNSIELKSTENLLLQCLLEGHTEKRDIIDAVWHNTVVTESSYHRLIFELRKQFSIIGLNQDKIKTIPRRGCVYTGTFSAITDSRERSTPDLTPDGELIAQTETDQETLIVMPATLATPTRNIAHRRALPYFNLLLTFIIFFLLGLAFSEYVMDKRADSTWAKNTVLIEPPLRKPVKITPKKNELLFVKQGEHYESYYLCENYQTSPGTSSVHGKQSTPPGDCVEYTYMY